jgi:glycolate oxidase FAD binding subunit
MDTKTATIDGVSMPLETPDTMAELAACVQRCAQDGTAVFPIGGGTGLNYGQPPSRPGLAISLQQLNRVVDYPVEDLTITVEAGMTVASLQALLAKNNQRLPIDVPNAEMATIGGAIAVNAAGPRRLGYGTWRDWIIGMTVVNDRGELCQSGGRVVKNVAGYDLGKLYCGSLGTLGMIAQVTLKLQPQPEAQQWVFLDGISVAAISATLDKIHQSMTQPRAVELVACGDSYKLFVLFEDNAPSVTWQIEQLRREFEQPVSRVDQSQVITGLVNRASVETAPLQLIATMRSSHIGPFLRNIAMADWAVQAQAMNGVIWTGHSTTNLEDFQSLLTRMSAAVGSLGGNVVIRRCSSDWKPRLPVWGRSPASLELMRKIKIEFDPKNLLSPGRTLV